MKKKNKYDGTYSYKKEETGLVPTNTCKKIKQSLDLKDGIWSFTEKKEGIIRECDILFTKIDKKRASEEVARLKENKI